MRVHTGFAVAASTGDCARFVQENKGVKKEVQVFRRLSQPRLSILPLPVEPIILEETEFIVTNPFEAVVAHLSNYAGTYSQTSSTELGVNLGEEGKCVSVNFQGDHGGGSMKYVLVIACADGDGQKHFVDVGSCAAKDDYSTMRSTCLPVINCGLNQLQNVSILFVYWVEDNDTNIKQFAFATIPTAAATPVVGVTR